MATRVAGSLSPGRWGGLRPPLVAGSLSFFFFSLFRRKSRRRRRWGAASARRRWAVAASGLIWLVD
jgi:hypothetical protein